VENIDGLYNNYLVKKAELETTYNNKVKEIKDNIISGCKYKEGMIIQFHDWKGRISSVGFNDLFDEQRLQIRFIDSETLTAIQIHESEFDRIKLLTDSEDLNMKLLEEGMARLEKEEESFKIAVEHITELHNNRVLELEKDINIIRKDCIHDWKPVGKTEDGYEYVCSICKKVSVAKVKG